MSDEVKKGPRRVLVPSRRLVSADKYDGDGKRIVPPAEFMRGIVTRQEMMDYLAETVLAATQKMYDQMSGEMLDYLEQMEASLRDEIRREFMRRTLRGRWILFTMRVRETTFGLFLIELGLMEPIGPTPALVVDAVQALDPSVQAAAHEREAALAELRRRVVAVGVAGGNLELPEGTTAEDAKRIDMELHPREYHEARAEVAALLRPSDG